MKLKKLIIVGMSVALIALCVTACGSKAPEKHLMGYPDSYAQDDFGADAYDGWCDNADTKYFAINDYYNMESQGTLHILNNFKTYQQSTEYTCGPSAAYMVLRWNGVKKYDELTIAKMSGCNETTGIGPEGIAKFFKEIGWDVQSHAGTDYTFEDLGEFEKWVVKNIDAGTPIMVDWIDWDGHWQNIIGIDRCKLDGNTSDDVLILADPYDTSDQYQDGYYTFSAERFFYMWHEGACTGKEPLQQPWVIATPPAKK